MVGYSSRSSWLKQVWAALGGWVCEGGWVGGRGGHAHNCTHTLAPPLPHTPLAAAQLHPPEGRRPGGPCARWIWNLWGPCTPCSALNPSRGTLLVPVCGGGGGTVGGGGGGVVWGLAGWLDAAHERPISPPHMCVPHLTPNTHTHSHSP